MRVRQIETQKLRKLSIKNKTKQEHEEAFYRYTGNKIRERTEDGRISHYWFSPLIPNAHDYFFSQQGHT